MIHLKKAPSYYPSESGERFMFKLSHDEMIRRFGAAHRLMDSNDDEPGPCEYWGYDVDGHALLIVFHFAIPDGPAAIVVSSLADTDRLIDVLGVRDIVVWRSEATT